MKKIDRGTTKTDQGTVREIEHGEEGDQAR